MVERLMPYTLQQELEALEKLQDWIDQSSDKQATVSTIITNIIDELSPREVSEVLIEFLSEHLDQNVG